MAKKPLPIFIVFTLLASLICQGPAIAQETQEIVADQIVEDELIVQYKLKSNLLVDEEVGEDEFLESLGQNYKLWEAASYKSRSTSSKLKHYRKLRRSRARKLRYKIAVLHLDGKITKKKLQKLVKRINQKKFQDLRYEIEAVYPNYLYEISSAPLDSEVSANLNDPLYNQQWSHKQVKPEKFWKFTKGEGAVVAVIDTGVDYAHQDLAANIWVNKDEIPGNGRDDDGNGFVDDIHGWDFVEKGGYNCVGGEDCSGEDNDPQDYNGHGTHVAGIIAAVQNNEVGISGVAPEAEVMVLRAGYSTGRSAFLKTTDIIEAITYAINNKADVINMSFAGAELTALADILNLAHDLGIVSVAAAGNSASTRLTYPAALDSVIAVGSIDNDNGKSYFSNYGEWVTVTAPGAYVLSTMPNNSYDFKTGTSMSAPHVAAVAALIKAKSKLDKLNADEVEERLLASAFETSFPKTLGSDETLGGLSADISFPLAVDALEMPAQAVIGTNINLQASASDSAADIVAYEWTSDVEGYLGAAQNLTTALSTLGSQVISVKALNSLGKWSEPEFKIINVVESRNVNPANLADDFRYTIKRQRGMLIALSGRRSRRGIKSYKWISNVDGTISNRRSLDLQRLSPGFHQISLSVQDKYGNWSDPLERVVKI